MSFLDAWLDTVVGGSDFVAQRTLHLICMLTGIRRDVFQGTISSTFMSVCLTWKASLQKKQIYIDGFLPKEPYLPCVSMSGRALLAGFHRICDVCFPLWANIVGSFPSDISTRPSSVANSSSFTLLIYAEIPCQKDEVWTQVFACNNSNNGSSVKVFLRCDFVIARLHINIYHTVLYYYVAASLLLLSHFRSSWLVEHISGYPACTEFPFHPFLLAYTRILWGYSHMCISCILWSLETCSRNSLPGI